MKTIRIYIKQADLTTMQTLVEAAATVEVCGLLGGRRKGTNAYVEQVIPIANIAANPQNQFWMEPQQQIQAMYTLAQAGLEVVGIYHSHPQGPLYPSETDINECAYLNVVYLIWWGVTVTAWIFQRKQALSVELCKMG